MDEEDFTARFYKLTPRQNEVLCKFLKKQTDKDISKDLKIGEAAVRKHIEKICKSFALVNEPGERNSLRRQLIALFVKYMPDLVSDELSPCPPIIKVKGPLTGVVPLDSPLYLERSSDEICKQALRSAKNRTDSSLPFIRIKASQGMGKSSLLVQLRHFLQTDQKQVVGFVDLGGINFAPDAFTNLHKLLYQFTYAIAQTFSTQLNDLNPPNLQEYWRKDIAPGLNCTNYLRDRIFSKIKQSKTLLIDGIDAVLGKEQIQNAFLNLLRSWNESEMKLVSKSPIVWPSMAIAYSTEPYSRYGMQGSPLQNVGIEVELKEFTEHEIQKQAKKYGLTWNSTQIRSLMHLIGGHPTLVNQALYQLSQNGMALSELELQATSPTSPFKNHLLEQLKLLLEKPDLLQCFKQILSGENCYSEFAKFQLDKAGLIKMEGEEVKVRFELYQKYFQAHF